MPLSSLGTISPIRFAEMSDLVVAQVFTAAHDVFLDERAGSARGRLGVQSYEQILASRLFPVGDIAEPNVTKLFNTEGRNGIVRMDDKYDLVLPNLVKLE